MIPRPGDRWLLAPRLTVLAVLLYALIESLTLIVDRKIDLEAYFYLAAFFYGAQRVFRYHPLYSVNYRRWLEVSPWTSRLPLPRGPVQFVWQDALVIALASAWAAIRWEGAWAWPVVAFAGGCALASLPAMFKAGTSILFIFSILLGVPFIFIFAFEPAALLMVALLLVIVANFGVASSLKRFPWPEKTEIPDVTLLGPVVSRLGPLTDPYQIRRGMGLAIALILAWWSAAIGVAVHRINGGLSNGSVFLVSGAIVIIVSLTRIPLYTNSHRSPLTMWGRIFTGRLILPSYDYVYLASLITPLAAILAGTLCAKANLEPEATLGIIIFIAVSLITELGPSLHNWRLTGGHSLFPLTASRERRRLTSPGEPELAWLTR